MHRFTVTKKAVQRYHSYNPHYFPLRFLCILFQKVSPYFNLWMSAEIVTALYKGKAKQELYFLVAVTLAGNFFVQTMNAILGRCADSARKVLDNNEAAAFYRKTLSLDYDKIENPKISLLRRKIRENAQINGYGVDFMRNLIEMLFSSIIDIMFSLVLFAEMISLIAKISFQWFGLFLLIAIVMFIIVNIIIQAKNGKKSSIYWNKVSAVMLDENRISTGYEMLGTDSRIYRQQEIVDQLYEKNNKDHLKIFSKVYTKVFVLGIPNIILFKFAELGSYLIICFYCVLGAFPVGSIIKYVGYLGRITESIGNVFYTGNQLKTNEQFLETYLEYFGLKNDMYQGSLAVEKRSDKKFEIEFKNVSFCYSGNEEKNTNEDFNLLEKNLETEDSQNREDMKDRLEASNSNKKIQDEKEFIVKSETAKTETFFQKESDSEAVEIKADKYNSAAESKKEQEDFQKNYALKNINLKLKVGERLAVVGKNGSGKTTFIKLLCRLYDPTEGEILMNDFNIRKYDYRQYLDLFSVVFQDYNLLAVPLGNNISSSGTWDEAKAQRILEEVGFGERYAKMSKGLETPLYKNFDEDGVNISGGEAQKIALARALYKDAPFIILDEPTAALDPVAEAEIYAKFDEIVGDKTAIYISHRLSSCRFCDKIAVFDQGRIVQVGTHEELLADKTGKYYELWYAQAQYYM